MNQPADTGPVDTSQLPGAQQVPLVDPGNPFVGNSEVAIAVGVDGQRVVFTIRSGGATMSIKLIPSAVDQLCEALQLNKAQLGGILLPPPGMDLSALGRHARMSEQLRNGH